MQPRILRDDAEAEETLATVVNGTAVGVLARERRGAALS
jgi:hypothetical protein